MLCQIELLAYFPRRPAGNRNTNLLRFTVQRALLVKPAVLLNLQPGCHRTLVARRRVVPPLTLTAS